MTKHKALIYLKAVTEAFGPGEGVEFDQKAWSALHAAIKEALAGAEGERQSEQKKCENCGEFGKCCQTQPEQEPFGYFRYDMRLDAWVMNREGQRPGTPFYTTPQNNPQRTWEKSWVSLTDEETDHIIRQPHGGADPQEWVKNLASALEAKLKEKNT